MRHLLRHIGERILYHSRSRAFRATALLLVPALSLLTGGGATSAIVIITGYAVAFAIYLMTVRPWQRPYRPRRGYLVPRELPPPPGLFSGREAEIATLHQLISQPLTGTRSSDPRLVIVHGPAGIGKTSLAVQFAHVVARQFPDGQLFASLNETAEVPSSSDRISDALRMFIEALQAPGDQPPPSLDQRLARFRRLTQHRRVLIVLDDASTGEDVVPLLPSQGGSLVLVTARQEISVPADAPAIVESLRLDPLSPEGAVELLSAIVGEAAVKDEPEQAQAIAAASLHFPLGLRLVGAMLASRPAWGLDAAARLMPKPTGQEESAAGDPLDPSYLLLTHHEQRAVELLGLVGNRPLAPWMLGTLMETSVDNARRVADRLVLAGLLERMDMGVAGAADYRIPDGVQAFAAQRLNSGTDDASLTELRTRLAKDVQARAVTGLDEILVVQNRGELTTAMTAARDAVSWARAVGDAHGESQALCALAHVQIEIGGLDAARELSATAWSLAVASGDAINQARAARCLGRIASRSRDLTTAVARFGEALSLLRQPDLAPAATLNELIRTYRHRAVSLAYLGSGREAQADLNSADELCASQPAPVARQVQVGLGWARGIVAMCAGDGERAELALQQAHAAAVSEDQELWHAWIELALARLAVHRQDYPSAVNLAQSAVDLFGGLGHRYGRAQSHIELAIGHQRRHGVGPAAAALGSALEALRNCGDRWLEADTTLRLARVLARTTRRDEVIPLLREAVALFTMAGDARMASRTRRLLRRREFRRLLVVPYLIESADLEAA